jgi:hypothetical protein
MWLQNAFLGGILANPQTHLRTTTFPGIKGDIFGHVSPIKSMKKVTRIFPYLELFSPN